MTFRAATWVLLAAVLLTACSTGGAAQDSAAAPAPEVTTPAGFRSVAVGDLTFSVPAAWSEVPAATGPVPETGGQELALRAPAAAGQPAPVVVAVLDPMPSRDAAAELDGLLTVKRDVQKAQVRVEPVALDGFVTADVVSYDEDLLTGERQHTDAIIGQLADGTFVSLTVKAEAALFGQLQLGAVVRSARAPRRT